MNNISRISFAVAMLGIAHMTMAQTLQEPATRMSDQAIVLDHQAYAKWQARIKALNDKGVRVGDYYLSKAQCWLDVSLHEYTRNDRSPFPQEAMAQSAAIIVALENGTQPNPGAQTPLINGASKLRDDIWARFASLKESAGFRCAAQKVACGEVELVHAGNEYQQQGWRHANPYVQMAEDMVQQADSAASQCQPVPVVAAMAAVAAVSAPAACPQALACVPGPEVARTREQLSLAADALFHFDKSALADLLPEGRAKIDEMMAKLDQVYSHIDRIRLIGFTDRLGNQDYNQKLSERRAATVQTYLHSKGFKGQVNTEGCGKAEQLVACNGVRPHAKLIACLQPNRRVVVEVVGVKR